MATATEQLVPLDPKQWEEPKERFIARLVTCKRSTTDDAKDRNGQTFTELRNWPRAGQTFEVAVELLDRVFVNKNTGEKSPVKRFMTLDLQRYNERTQQMENAMQGSSKASFTIEKWIDCKVVLHPDPTKNEGLVAEFELLRSVRIGKQTAKNVLYPVKILALPGRDYEYRGDVEEIEFTPSEESEDGISLDDAATEAQSSSNGSKSGKTAKADVLDEDGVRALFEGVDTDDEDAVMEVIQANKGAIPAQMKAKILGGDFFQTE